MMWILYVLTICQWRQGCSIIVCCDGCEMSVWVWYKGGWWVVMGRVWVVTGWLLITDCPMCSYWLIMDVQITDLFKIIWFIVINYISSI